MKKHYLVLLAILGSCTAAHAESQEWLMLSDGKNHKLYINKIDLNKGKFDQPFLMRTKSIIEHSETNHAGDSVTITNNYVDCQNMRIAVAESIYDSVGYDGKVKKTERQYNFDSRQQPPDNAWKSLGIALKSPNNFCRKVSGWDENKVKLAYPNTNWRVVDKDNPIFFLNESDISFATNSKPFPVRAKSFLILNLEQGDTTAVIFTELIDCKNGKSRPISKLYTANDTLLENNQNPTVIHTEAVNGEWRQFNEKNKVFSEICKPLNK